MSELTPVECHGLDTAEMVRFYEHDFYPLSNFSAFRIKWKGITFDTSEMVYHHEKFPHRPDIQKFLLNLPSSHEVFKAAGSYKGLERPDWNLVRVPIMHQILLAKVDQHEYVRRKLLATGDRILVEDSWRDGFWGWGSDQKGSNMLGNLWMIVRKELREK